ncbi:MAG TPA: efflux RND transporter periplasmic adaptor subunit [Gammaproteobacteria bacterium]|nr:efflux RND transporter periplasmic adaptor subunit [Gammaproteobacteria bacterium]
MSRNSLIPRVIKFTVRLLVLLAVIAGAGYGYIKYYKKHDADKAAQYQFVIVETGRIEENVTAQGKLETEEYVDVGAQVSGQLKKLHVQIGDTVKKGDLIAEIDPRVYESKVEADKAQLKTLQAQIAEQQAQVVLARQVYERNKRLIQSHAVSQETLEDSDTSLKVAQARVASLKAQLEQAQSTLDGDETNLSYTKIYAPMDGTVVSQTAREGQTLNAVQSAPVIVQVANLDTLTVRAQVAEADVMRLKPGIPVYFTTLGSTDRRWHATVRQIQPSPEVINEVVLYDALVDVDNRDRQLMTGMSTQMFFVLGEAKDVPLIPVAALGKRLADQDNDQGRAYQVRISGGDGRLASKIIHVGLMSRTVAEVRSGLTTGDKVALAARQETTGTDSQKSGAVHMPAHL